MRVQWSPATTAPTPHLHLHLLHLLHNHLRRSTELLCATQRTHWLQNSRVGIRRSRVGLVGHASEKSTFLVLCSLYMVRTLRRRITRGQPPRVVSQPLRGGACDLERPLGVLKTVAMMTCHSCALLGLLTESQTTLPWQPSTSAHQRLYPHVQLSEDFDVDKCRDCRWASSTGI